jgi:hypothetical protein
MERWRQERFIFKILRRVAFLLLNGKQQLRFTIRVSAINQVRAYILILTSALLKLILSLIILYLLLIEQYFFISMMI